MDSSIKKIIEKICNIKLIIMLFIVLVNREMSAYQSIKVVAVDNYPPYNIRDKSGTFNGIIVDQWNHWSRKTGVDVKIIGAGYDEALRMIDEGRADVIDLVFYSAENRVRFDLSPPYATIESAIFHSAGLSGVDSIETLPGYIVGVKKNDASIGLLRGKGITSLRYYSGYEEMIRDAVDGKIHVFCADIPVALYYIYRYRAEIRFRHQHVIYKNTIHRGVKRGNYPLLNLVNEGFNRINEVEYRSIDNKWFDTGLRLDYISNYIIFILPGTAAFFLFLVLLNIYSRLKIRMKTGELRRVVEELQISESKNRALLMANPDMLYVFDSEGNFIDYKSEGDMSRYIASFNLIGENISDIVPGDVAEKSFRNLELVKRTGDMQSYEYDYEIDGERRYFDARMMKFSEDKFLAIVRDISEKKKKDEEKVRSHKLESLGIFAGGIAHDFNNILSAIVGSISLARMKFDDREKAMKFLGDAEKAGLRARRLTEQLLAFAKGGTPVKEITDVKELVIEAADFTMSGSKTALKYSIDQDIARAEIDRGQIGQVIQNIILNASQSMSSGGVIEISIGNRILKEDNSLMLPGGKYIAIEIKDEGTGIESKNLKKIFDPYFTTKSEGNGLGLTICHSIVKRHGGAIDVKSETGKGSTFIILLPASDEDAADMQEELFPEKDVDLKNLKIMIMDDEPQLRFIMEEILKDEGAEIITVPEGGEAIDIFEKMSDSNRPVNIVIADLTIPGGMGGMEAVRIMREQGLPFKAIVISGYSNDPVLSEYDSYGFDAYIAKPFTSDDLLSVVKSVLKR